MLSRYLTLSWTVQDVRGSMKTSPLRKLISGYYCSALLEITVLFIA